MSALSFYLTPASHNAAAACLCLSLLTTPMEFSSRALKYMQLTLGILLALTVGLLSWHHYGMERVFELSAAAQSRLQVGDDRGQGGASIGTLHNDGKVLRMDCTIVKKVDWPFCQLIFPLGDGIDGMDMSGFDYVTFDVVSSGP